MRCGAVSPSSFTNRFFLSGYRGIPLKSSCARAEREGRLWVDIFRGFEDRTELSQMIRLLTIACVCAVSLEIAIWSGLVAGWTTRVGSSLGDAATTLERATEPRSALTSPSDPLNRDVTAAREDVAAGREEIRKLKEAWRQTSAAKQMESARAIADLSAAREDIRTLRASHREAEKKVSDAVEKQVQERARAEALDRDLAAARQEIQTLKVR
jgi:hypothetical protein